MVKVETIGMIEVSKLNPVLKATKDVDNYSFMTFDDDLYLISNTVVGDDAYKDEVTIPKGEYLNGYLVKAWDGQNIFVDQKHTATGDVADYSVGDTLVADTNGKLKATTETVTGVHFEVVAKVVLTEPALKVKVVA